MRTMPTKVPNLLLPSTRTTKLYLADLGINVII